MDRKNVLGIISFTHTITIEDVFDAYHRTRTYVDGKLISDLAMRHYFLGKVV